ncbi:hypothetical protein E4T56_gene19450 [Termitomyces sp. T112]|nr:hypothetical protein E4T56_gene19450 [Termitomyces sp. T112]
MMVLPSKKNLYIFHFASGKRRFGWRTAWTVYGTLALSTHYAIRSVTVYVVEFYQGRIVFKCTLPIRSSHL